MDDDYISLEGMVEYATPKAILFQADFQEKAEWLPRSQIVLEDLDEGKVKVRIKAWLARKLGWSE